MSHYAVAVFTEQDGCQTYEDLLKPYDEDLIVPHYISKEELITEVRALSPDRLNWTDEECYTYGAKYYSLEDIKPDGSVFERNNPNAKWDWYTVGGRFSDCVPLIDGGFDNEADMIDVDIDYRNEKQYRKAIRFWQLYVEGETPVTEEDKNLIKYAFYKKEYYTERYKDAEDYADECSGFTFYAALLPNSEWLEPGKMGWFGVSSATANDDIRWRLIEKQILQKAKENNWHITMVDCHI